jgi:methionyl-tRNA synthetase
LAGLPDVGELPLPKTVFGHGFLLAAARKCRSRSAMSSIRWLAERFGVDALRYFLLRESASARTAATAPRRSSTAPTASSPTASATSPSSSLSMIFKNLNGVLPAAGHAPDDQALLEQVRVRPGAYRSKTSSNASPFSAGLEAWYGARVRLQWNM